MRKEYWAATWVKIVFLGNSFVMGVGVWGLIQPPMDNGYLFYVVDVVCIIYGVVFSLAAKGSIQSPVIIIEGGRIIARGLLGGSYALSNIEQYSIHWRNQTISLHDEDGKKYVLRTNLISNKDANELYDYLLNYCKPLSEFNKWRK